ncbi:MAG: hypothetical protein WAW62_01235 [Candidatus Saccharimonas aalborgensis]
MEYKEPENPATSVLEALKRLKEAPRHAVLYLLIMLEAREGREPGFELIMMFETAKWRHFELTGSDTAAVVKLHELGLVRYNIKEWRQELTDLGADVAQHLSALRPFASTLYGLP